MLWASIFPALPLAPDKEHDGVQGSAGQRHELCQFKREPIEVVDLEIDLAQKKQKLWNDQVSFDQK